MKISVLVPIKNEPYINRLINGIHGVLKKVSHEIIVIDKSDTPPKLKNAKLILQKSNGLGKAVLEGLKYATGDVIVTMDGDGSHRAIDIMELVGALNVADIVIGSKFIKGGKTEDHYHRKIISDFYRSLESIVLHIGVKDSMSGFAVIKKEIYDRIHLNPMGYKINLEIMYKAKKLGFKIKEVPIVFNPRKSGKSKSKLFEGLKTLIFIFKLKLGY